MLDPVDTRDPDAVEGEVRSTCVALFPDVDRAFIARAFGWATQCFRGELDGYQPIDVGYHDFEHTLQGALCLIRLLQGRHRAGVQPVLTLDAFELGLLAILFHDTGYLKTRNDREGTGAKYTAVHVGRSADFAKAFLGPRGFAESQLRAVQNMIGCTGLGTELSTIRFQSELERAVGYALATADLLGQMAARDYVARLADLYVEFAEAALHATGATARLFRFDSAEALIRSTPAFWDGYVRPKLDRELGGLHAFLADPYPDGPNPYVERIEANLAPLRGQLATPVA